MSVFVVLCLSTLRQQNIASVSNPKQCQYARRPYPPDPRSRGVLQHHIQCQMDDSIIQPTQTQCAVFAILVPNKYATTLLCVDFDLLNLPTGSDAYPLSDESLH